MRDRLQPAFWGGLFIGVLSGLPIIEAGNACCCLWVISGGVLSVWLAQQNTTYSIRAAEGALIGVSAGLIGAIIAFPLNLLFEDWKRDLFLRLIELTNAEIPPDFGAVLNTRAGAISRVISLLVSLVAYGIFGLLGGLLGAAIFKKNVPPPPPPGTIEVLPPQ